MRRANRSWEGASGPPALVLGSGITALGVLRTLGRAGVHAFAASVNPGSMKYSRWYDPSPIPMGDDDHRDLISFMGSLPLEKAVLFPCSDHLALAVARSAAVLGQRFPTYLPPASALETLTNKASFYRVLRDLGIPHPVTTLNPTREEVEEALHSPSRRAFLKPLDSQRFFQVFGVKGLWLGGPGQRDEDQLRDLAAAGDVLMQDYVPGPPSNHFFIDGFSEDGGNVTAWFARRRLRMYPPDFGNSSYMVTVPLEEVDAATTALARLLAALSYRGIFSAEFKRDEQTGVFRLLEVNGRPWWFVAFAARCGVDVVSMTYRAALGVSEPMVSGYEIGRRMVHPYYDIQACRLDSGSRLGGMARFLRCLPGAMQPVFCLDDPAPSLADLGGFLKGFLGRRFVRFSHRRPGTQA